MALATQCPHCSTTFRVASDQLKLRGGIVRCGACNEVFDGNASLIDLDALAARQASEPAPEPETVAQVEPEPSASAAFDAEVAAIDAKVASSTEPIYTLDFDTTFDPFGILPKSALPAAPQPEPEPETEVEAAPAPEPEHAPEAELAPEAEHAPEPEHAPEAGQAPEHDDVTELEHAPEHDDLAEQPADAEPVAEYESEAELADAGPASELHFGEETVDAPLPDADSDHEVESEDHHPSLLLRESAPPEPLPAVEVELTPTATAVEPVPAAAHEHEHEPDEPEFVKRGRRLEEAGRSRRILLGAGSGVLLLVLAFQGVTIFRNGLAARFPELKPALAETCKLLGCRLDLPAQVEMLSVEPGELQALGGNTFSFTTLLRNQGGLLQAWPNIELALTDANDKPLVRRVFTPADYLAPGPLAANGFAPRSEQPVKLYFELNAIKASGYHIAVFYP